MPKMETEDERKAALDTMALCEKELKLAMNDILQRYRWPMRFRLRSAEVKFMDVTNLSSTLGREYLVSAVELVGQLGEDEK